MVIQECVVYVRGVAKAPSILVSHGQSIQQTTTKYTIGCVDCKIVSVPRRNMSENQPNIFQSALPNRIMIGMVDTGTLNDTKVPISRTH